MLCQFINKGISKRLKVSTRLFQMGDDLLKGNILPKSTTIKKYFISLKPIMSYASSEKVSK